VTTVIPTKPGIPLSLTGNTQVYAILGDPVAHSLSPLIQNTAFAAAGINAVYVPFHVEPAQLANAVIGLRALAVCGFNVTVPHKQAIMPYLDHVSEDAEAIGAVNTVVRRGDMLEGHNTDAGGFIRSLERDLEFSAYGKRILILGAGGAARACVYALAQAQTTDICIANRNLERAKKLCSDFGSFFPATHMGCCGIRGSEFNAACAGADLIVNTTSLGLLNTGTDVLEWENINSKTLFYDVVYKPGLTPMVLRARSAGLKAVDGLGMLIAQGEQGFRLWTGTDPGDAMHRALTDMA
jgi:shikimate dehydrogenase